MNVVAEVRRDREDLARVLKKHTGIRKIVEDLYPDSAHFIYELLQNAEDTGASHVRFALSAKALVFEHDGRPFDEQDIYAITDIGEGTKATDEEKIGRFGIGFKAVFAYTETPRIWSPTFSFEISELVLPAELSAISSLGKITRFEFPFNNQKKLAADAFAEVRSGLDEISETTLLFLSHIESIRWQVEGNAECCVLRVAHTEQHIETLKKSGSKILESSHFLRFTHPVEGLEKQNTAIAFALDALPTESEFDPAIPLAKQFRIVPAMPGRVAVYFNAEKETSGLRFHLHAPFVPELSRASIKDTPANKPLFGQLATLIAHSLFTIRDLGFMNADFLAVLPNSNDVIPDRYKCIRKAIVDAMNEQPLTPTHTKAHAPAKTLIQGKVSLKALLDPKDIEYLVDYQETPPVWAIGVAQKNSDIDRFLSGLAIRAWDVEQFVGVLEGRLDAGGCYWDDKVCEFVDGPDAEFVKWLGTKTEEWHQKFYAFLFRELEPESEIYRLENLCIVRLPTGEYRVGGDCYFPAGENEEDLLLPRVARGTYTSGKSKPEQDNARKLLEEIGVREVGEKEEVEAILKQRYSEEAEIPSKKTYANDIRRFMGLVEVDPSAASLFKNYWIFERSDGKWGQPSQVYLDVPFLDTGLRHYYKVFGDKAERVALANSYMNLGISIKKFLQFTQQIGAATQLKVTATSCRKNPDWEYLRSVPGDRYTSPVNTDYHILGLDELLAEPSIEISDLVWKTVCNLPKHPDYLQARYRKNQTNGSRYADSQLVHQLRSSCWIPQNGNFVRPAEAYSDLLPEGFPFDPGWSWVKAVHFGEESAREIEEHRRKLEVAKELGFQDDQALDDGKWFADLSAADREHFKVEYERRRVSDLPTQDPNNPERRAARVGEQATEAPERIAEMRTRSVSIGRESVKKDTDPYLRQQYTNGDGVMICQVCKQALPFKLADGSYFFEAVEFIPELRNRHYQNYLALCPNHSAMYRHANGTRELLKDLFLELVGNEMELVLAGEDASLYFTRAHIVDLRAIIDAEDQESVAS
jgi:hypothetical protein